MESTQLKNISTKTLAHYENSAQSFWEGTRDHDVSQNRSALLSYLPQNEPQRILDFGCGPGRDLQAFKAAGHLPTGLDGTASFCEMASAYVGCEVWHQDFLALELPTEQFNGVFANASLFHVPSHELPRVLAQLWETLLPGGVFFSSNPRGDNVEGWNGERYGCYHSLNVWRQYMTAAKFIELSHYYRPPGLPRAQQPWLATVWRK